MFQHEALTPEGTMQRILIATAEEGMILAKDVEGPDGRLLCGKGTTLDQRLIQRLQAMGVSSITVQGDSPESGEASVEEKLRRVEERFSRVTHIPPLMLLKQKILEKIITARG